MPTCVKCGKHVFQLNEHTPMGSKFKLMFVQCSGCGGVIGVTDYYNIGAMTKSLGQALADIADKLGVHLDRAVRDWLTKP
jgi:hypothetical protein